MPTDPFHDALMEAGDGPNPTFVDDLEQLVARAYDGEMIARPSQIRAGAIEDRAVSRRRRNLLAVAVAVAIAVLAVGVIAARVGDGTSTIVDTPPPSSVDVTVAPASSVVPATSTTTASTTTATTTSTTATTAPSIANAIEATIDLEATAPLLAPEVIAAYPADMASATDASLADASLITIAPAGPDRVAVLDPAAGTLRFIDAHSGAELSVHPIVVPTDAVRGLAATRFFVGPDDIVYFNVRGPAIVAYGPRDGSYVEIARQGHGVGDSPIVQAASGIAVLFTPTQPLMAYVGPDGLPSGKVLAITDLQQFGVDDNGTVSLQRGSYAWEISYTYQQCLFEEPEFSENCVPLNLGPGDTLVLTDAVELAQSAGLPAGSRQRKVTLLADEVTTYDTDWDFAGSLGDSLLFIRSAGRTEIGVVPLDATTAGQPGTALDTSGTVDLGADAPDLSVASLATYPTGVPDGTTLELKVAPASDNRIAVLDRAQGFVRFLDATSGAEGSRFPLVLDPEISAELTSELFVGPQDVLYIGAGYDSPAIIAVGLRDGSYVEIARQSYGGGDGWVRLGPAGIVVTNLEQNPLMPFVGLDGAPSGARLDVVEFGAISADGDLVMIERGARRWTVDVVGKACQDGGSLCLSVAYGPAGSVVMLDVELGPDRSIRQRLTLLTDRVASFDTEWHYAGPLADALLFTRTVDGTTEIGTVALADLVPAAPTG